MNPYGNLIQGTDGLLYGLTSAGGLNNAGTLFSYDLSNHVFTKLHDFYPADGAVPFGSLSQSGNLLCGTTSAGGTFNKGVMFNYNLTNGIYAKLVEFDGTNGAAPNGAFISVTITGIAENKHSSSISVFPNPVHDKLNIDLSGNVIENATINFRDINGNIAYSFSQQIGSAKTTSINVKDIHKGTYFVEVKTDKETFVKKVVKQ